MQSASCGGSCPPADLALPPAMTDSLSTMTSSITSLISPGDSGVAMLDSEAEATSVGEDVLDGPTPPEENRPASPACKLECMTRSDIANGNNQDPSEVIIFRRRPKSKRSGTNSADTKPNRVSFHDDLVQPQHANNESVDRSRERLSWCASETSDYLDRSNPSSCMHRSCSSSSGASSCSNLPNDKDMAILAAFVKSLDCGNKSGRPGGSGNATPSGDGNGKSKLRPATSVCVSKGMREPPKVRGSREQSAAGVLSAVRSLIAGSPSAAARSIQAVPVAERGAPEGQEDPPLSASTLDLYHHADVAEGIRDGILPTHSSTGSDCGSNYTQPASCRRTPASPSRSHLRQSRRFTGSSSNFSVLREAPSKSCLVNRFLRLLTEKKLQSNRPAASTHARRHALQRPPRPSLYIKGARPVEELSKEILDELEEEIRRAAIPAQTCAMELVVSPAIRDRLMSDVLSTRIESPCKIYRVRVWSEKNSSEVMLTVLTERAVYLIDHLWNASHVLLLAHLDSILLGPGSHWVRLYSNNGVPKTQKSALTEITLLLGDVASTRQLLSHIELAVRRLSLPGRRIPAVHRFSLEDLTSSPSWSALLLGEVVHHCAVVHAADVCPSPPSTPLGPSRQGYFMFSHINGRNHIWTAGFFVLKAGVLYHFANEEKQMPILSLPLATLRPRQALLSRPHTLELGHLLLAAPDEATARDWLRALNRAATGDELNCSIEEPPTAVQLATFILTEERLLLIAGLDSSAPVLLVAHLNDVASMQTGDDEEAWCVLDLACREASESVGDFVVYFASSCEIQLFKDAMCRLRPDFEQSWTRISHSSSLRPRCQKMQYELSSSWSIFLSTLGRD